MSQGLPGVTEPQVPPEETYSLTHPLLSSSLPYAISLSSSLTASCIHSQIKHLHTYLVSRYGFRVYQSKFNRSVSTYHELAGHWIKLIVCLFILILLATQ